MFRRRKPSPLKDDDSQPKSRISTKQSTPRRHRGLSLLIILSIVLITTTLFTTLNNKNHRSIEVWGQWLGSSFVRRYNKLKLCLNIKVDTSWDGQSTFIFDRMHARSIDANARVEPSANFVVDIGAHDGEWLSNSNYFIQNGFGGLLIEPNSKTFEMLKSSHPKATVLNFSSDLNRDGVAKHDKVMLLKAGIQINDGKGKGNIIDNGWMDATEAKIEVTNKGDVDLASISFLLQLANVPKRFAVLSLDVEWPQSSTFAVVKQMVNAGFRPEYMILETSGNKDGKRIMSGLGYRWITTMRYDDIYELAVLIK